MVLNKNEQAKILIEALPYMQRFQGKTMVIKYGGNAMTNAKIKQAVMKDILLLHMIGIKVVVVHGGGPDITDALAQQGIESKFINGLRVTDKATIDTVSSVLSGKVNKGLVLDLTSLGAPAIGLSGIDGNMIQAKQLDSELGYVGKITQINTQVIKMALANNFIPVIAPTGVGDNGEIYNINADTAAVNIAAELKAEKFILLTNIAGVMRDKEDPTSLISAMNIAEVEQLIADGIIAGGMIPKVRACVQAMKQGLKETTIIDGGLEDSLLLELFSDVGIGTLIHQ
ncbi:MAG: acetylglutamate kinase [Lactobacillaceae bacterium]|jgi:acetylglutamate kinase|nr:acetylglutamate kinase [Lactobacillaceae bacterium]